MHQEQHLWIPAFGAVDLAWTVRSFPTVLCCCLRASFPRKRESS